MKPDRLNACLQLVAQTACGFDLTEYLTKAEKQLRGFVASAGAEKARIGCGTRAKQASWRTPTPILHGFSASRPEILHHRCRGIAAVATASVTDPTSAQVIRDALGFDILDILHKKEFPDEDLSV